MLHCALIFQSLQSLLDIGASPEAAVASSTADAAPSDRPPASGAVLTALKDQEAGWVQNVGKSGRARAALSAKSSESISKEAAPLASEARQVVEEQAAGPHVQATVEGWTHKASLWDGLPGRSQSILSGERVLCLAKTALCQCSCKPRRSHGYLMLEARC